ncbi:MAG: aminopeptidase [Ruminococcus sp.]|nr:aminopeptidase [Candidatus Copronaster equi]
MSEEKTEAELLREKLFAENKHCAQVVDDAEFNKAMDFAEDYKKFLNENKTEREVAEFIVEQAEKNGYVPFDKFKKYNAGDKVYYCNRKKAVILAVIGKKSIAEGTHIAAAHIDSPRLDLKPNPLYESNDIAYFKTHYYGGIRKYQWPVMPLSLHGIVVLKDGTQVKVNIGEADDEPKFVISDLLPHLSKEQNKRTLNEGIKGEELNIIVGSLPFNTDKGSELVKLNILKILNEKYSMTEADFLTAELEAVPATKVSDIGFDRSLIGGYGHDDRVCAYPELRAILDVEAPEYTSVAVFTDKEETGSDGNTGLCSAYLSNFIADLARAEGYMGRDVLSKSKCLSADVNAAFDPTFPSPFEAANASFLNKGIVVTKYTGGGGKGGTSDASAEFVGEVTRTFNKNNVKWQMGELGAVDAGGGGTVAKYIANLDVDVVDVGVPVLSMHSPFEVIAKFDVYMANKAFYSFFID